MMHHDQMALWAIFEDKNEIGAGGCDPNLQGGFSYLKHWSMDEVHISSCHSYT